MHRRPRQRSAPTAISAQTVSAARPRARRDRPSRSVDPAAHGVEGGCVLLPREELAAEQAEPLQRMAAQVVLAALEHRDLDLAARGPPPRWGRPCRAAAPGGPSSRSRRRRAGRSRARESGTQGSCPCPCRPRRGGAARKRAQPRPRPRERPAPGGTRSLGEPARGARRAENASTRDSVRSAAAGGTPVRPGSEKCSHRAYVSCLTRRPAPL